MTGAETSRRTPARSEDPMLTGAEAGWRLKEQLAELQYLAWLQRGVRLGLRALWLGGAGFLFGWGLNALWGWLPSVRYWILASLALALLPLYGLALSLTGRKRWVWTMDRRLGLKEQVSTAWEVAQRGQPGDLSDALVADVLAVIPRVRRRMLRRGWFIERDLVAAAIVLSLGALVLISTQLSSLSASIAQNPLASNPPIEQPEPFPELIPTLPPDPSGERSESPPANPEGTQGQDGESSGENSQGEGPSPEDSPSSGNQPGDSGGSSPNLDPGALGEALQELGSDLSQQAPTYDLGQSLQDLNLEGAAGELDELTDQLEDLSPETREKMAEAMDEAAEDAEAAGDPSLSQDLRDAAEALQEQGSGDENRRDGAGEALEQLAQDLRELAQENQQASGSGAGGSSSGQTGRPEPAERLQGEGGDLELPLEDSSQSGLLSPAPPQEGGSGTAGGSLDNTAQGGEDVVHTPLLPNSFLWKWRDVVSSYFQR